MLLGQSNMKKRPQTNLKKFQDHEEGDNDKKVLKDLHTKNILPLKKTAPLTKNFNEKFYGTKVIPLINCNKTGLVPQY